MANADKPMGLRPVKHLNGNPYNGQFNMYYVPSSDSTALYIGDPVISAGGGDSTGKFQSVTRFTGTGPILGVIIGFANQPYINVDVTELERVYRPASTAMYVAVCDDPDVIFEVQEDSVGENMDKSDLGATADLTTTAGSSTTGLSGIELDSSSISDVEQDCLVLSVADRPDNALGANCNWNVLLNNHAFRVTTGA